MDALGGARLSYASRGEIPSRIGWAEVRGLMRFDPHTINLGLMFTKTNAAFQAAWLGGLYPALQAGLTYLSPLGLGWVVCYSLVW